MLASDSPLAAAATAAVKSGDVAALRALLAQHPALATERIGDDTMSGTLLHAATDWPGGHPHVSETVAVLVAAGADVNARFAGPHNETPLHWAASSDDLAALDALLDVGADIEADGGVIAGGTPLYDAVALGQWGAARRLVERGARAELWHDAALGRIGQVRHHIRTGATVDELTYALWHAANGGQAEACQLLVHAGANRRWTGWDDLTPAGAAARSGHDDLARWLGT